MDILVLGGTVFLSRAMVETALTRGHNVTTFNRGVTASPVDGATAVIGDRTKPDELQQLRGKHFDLVFDTGYFPDQVRATAELLEPTVGHYIFVSSINAFPGWPDQANYQAGGVYEGDPDSIGDAVPAAIQAGGAYGWRKVGAERAVLRTFGQHRSSILRAGLIVGPRDGIGRLPWWLNRISRGGSTLAPGAPEDDIRLIDCRDLAEFALLQPVGVFETSGPARQISRRQLFEEARQITGSDAEFVWVPDEWLTQHGVEGWTELPLWTATSQAPGLWAHDTTAAEAAGLACRPVRDTVIDTWEWMRSIDGGWQPSERAPGLAADKEADLLEAWTAARS
jgi:2'-hydroxyisoflavone reductase